MMRTQWLGLVFVTACSNPSPVAIDAPFIPIDARPDAPPPTNPHPLNINEVAASETPDWFEIVNLTSEPVQLADYLYIDARDDFSKAATFPPMMLAPGGYYVQNVDDTTAGFKLASDEELWVYRAAHHVLIDGIDWKAGDSPAGMSYARVPDKTGSFTTTSQSKGLPNP